MSRAKGKNPSDDSAGGVSVTKCADRAPQGVFEVVRRMSDNP